VYSNRRIVKAVLAVVVPLGMIGSLALFSGTASAKAATGTISCTGLTSTLNFSPALVPGTATSKTEQVTITGGTLTSCTTTPSSAVTAATSVAAKATKSKNGNSCASLAGGGKPTKYTFTVNWNNGGGKSVIKFTGSTTNSAPPGFTLGPGKQSGSYKSSNAMVTANLSPTSAAAIEACIGGTGPNISSLTISSGNSSG